MQVGGVCYYGTMFDTVVHKWFRVPYPLHVRLFRPVKHARVTYLFIHGIGDTGAMWQPLVDSLPDSIQYVAVDLLGFGESPSPRWSNYTAAVHARSILATFLTLRITTPVIIVGHSLGSLVAVEFAKRYPYLVKRLVLCSPPIYEPIKENGHTLKKPAMLRFLYQQAAKDPRIIVNSYGLGKKLRVINSSLNVISENVDLFVRTLEQSIINQTTIDDITKLREPVTIVTGAFDPFVVNATLVKLSRASSTVRVKTIVASHIVNKTYQKELLKELGFISPPSHLTRPQRHKQIR